MAVIDGSMADSRATDAVRAANLPTVHGTPSLSMYPPGATHGPRALDDYEFVWVVAGGGHLTTSVDATRLEAGCLYLLAPGPVHEFSWDADEPTIHGYVHFVPPVARLPDDWPFVQQRPFTADDPLAALCRYLAWLGGHPQAASEPQIERTVGYLLDVFLDGPVVARQPMPVVDAVLEHLAGAWHGGTMRPVPLAELAAAAAVSVGHMCRTFRREVGAGPVATVELIRLARAANLLGRSSLSLAEIADVTGFADQYHLSRRFRRVMGLPPSTYRQASTRREQTLPVAVVAVLPLLDRVTTV